MDYYQKIIDTQPYTDEKGYEVLTPFPWGRWQDLKTAYSETREGNIVDQVNPEEAEKLQGVSVFLFAGVGTPSGSLDIGSSLQKELTNCKRIHRRNASFELVTPSASALNADDALVINPQPDSFFKNVTDQSIQQRVNLFLTGNAQPSESTQAELNLVTDANE
jgi:hypothetical protein